MIRSFLVPKTFCLALSLATSVAISTYAADGVSGGNTELFRPRNARGQLIEISFSSKQPLHDKLVELIRKADLPVILKNEMLGDLDATAVMYSNEIVTYADTQRQLQMMLTKVVRTKVKNSNGTTSERTQEEYSPAAADSLLGVHVAPMNMLVRGLNDAFVAAYTQGGPRRVVFFTPMLEKLTEEETLRLVLHEQAHRLTTLGSFRNDERFIDGWSSTLLRYLQGKVTKSVLMGILNRNGIRAETMTGIQGERFFQSEQFLANITITIGASDVTFRGVIGSEYVIQVSKKVFDNYPQVKQQADFLKIIMTPEVGPESFEAIERFFRETIDQGHPITLPLSLFYKKEPQPDSLGRLYTVLVLSRAPMYFPLDRMLAIESLGRSLMMRHQLASDKGDKVFTFPRLSDVRASVDGSRSATVFYISSEIYTRMQAALANLDQALSEIEVEAPMLAKRMKQRQWGLTLAESEVGKPSSFSENYGMLLLKLSLDKNDASSDLSPAQMKAEIAKMVTPLSFPTWRALEPINSKLDYDVAHVESKNEDPADLAAIAGMLARSPAFSSRLSCIGAAASNDSSRSRSRVVVNIDLVDEGGFSWDFTANIPSYYSSFATLDLNIAVPRQIAKLHPEVAAEFLLSSVVSARGVSEGNVRRGGSGIWKTGDVRAKIIYSNRFLGGDGIGEVLARCGGRKGH